MDGIREYLERALRMVVTATPADNEFFDEGILSRRPAVAAWIKSYRAARDAVEEFVDYGSLGPDCTPVMLQAVSALLKIVRLQGAVPFADPFDKSGSSGSGLVRTCLSAIVIGAVPPSYAELNVRAAEVFMASYAAVCLKLHNTRTDYLAESVDTLTGLLAQATTDGEAIDRASPVATFGVVMERGRLATATGAVPPDYPQLVTVLNGEATVSPNVPLPLVTAHTRIDQDMARLRGLPAAVSTHATLPAPRTREELKLAYADLVHGLRTATTQYVTGAWRLFRRVKRHGAGTGYELVAATVNDYVQRWMLRRSVYSAPLIHMRQYRPVVSVPIAAHSETEAYGSTSLARMYDMFMAGETLPIPTQEFIDAADALEAVLLEQHGQIPSRINDVITTIVVMQQHTEEGFEHIIGAAQVRKYYSYSVEAFITLGLRRAIQFLAAANPHAARIVRDEVTAEMVKGYEANPEECYEYVNPFSCKLQLLTHIYDMADHEGEQKMHRFIQISCGPSTQGKCVRAAVIYQRPTFTPGELDACETGTWPGADGTPYVYIGHVSDHHSWVVLHTNCPVEQVSVPPWQLNLTELVALVSVENHCWRITRVNPPNTQRRAVEWSSKADEAGYEDCCRRLGKTREDLRGLVAQKLEDIANATRVVRHGHWYGTVVPVEDSSQFQQSLTRRCGALIGVCDEGPGESAFAIQCSQALGAEYTACLPSLELAQVLPYHGVLLTGRAPTNPPIDTMMQAVEPRGVFWSPDTLMRLRARYPRAFMGLGQEALADLDSPGALQVHSRLILLVEPNKHTNRVEWTVSRASHQYLNGRRVDLIPPEELLEMPERVVVLFKISQPKISYLRVVDYTRYDEDSGVWSFAEQEFTLTYGPDLASTVSLSGITLSERDQEGLAAQGLSGIHDTPYAVIVRSDRDCEGLRLVGNRPEEVHLPWSTEWQQAEVGLAERTTLLFKEVLDNVCLVTGSCEYYAPRWKDPKATANEPIYVAYDYETCNSNEEARLNGYCVTKPLILHACWIPPEADDAYAPAQAAKQRTVEAYEAGIERTIQIATAAAEAAHAKALTGLNQLIEHAAIPPSVLTEWRDSALESHGSPRFLAAVAARNTFNDQYSGLLTDLTYALERVLQARKAVSGASRTVMTERDRLREVPAMARVQYEGLECTTGFLKWVKSLSIRYPDRKIICFSFNGASFDTHLLLGCLADQDQFDFGYEEIDSYGRLRSNAGIQNAGSKILELRYGNILFHDIRRVIMMSLANAAKSLGCGAVKSAWSHSATQTLFEACGYDHGRFFAALRARPARDFAPGATGSAYAAFHEYCANDCVVTLEVAWRLITSYSAMTDGGMRVDKSMTLPQAAYKYIMKASLEATGLHLHRPGTVKEYEFMQRAKLGGRSQVFMTCPRGFAERAVLAIDEVSQYPHKLIQAPFVLDGAGRWVEHYAPNTLGVYRIRVTRQPELIVLPYRGQDNGLDTHLWDWRRGPFETYATSVLLVLHWVLGGEAEVIEGLVFDRYARGALTPALMSFKKEKQDQDAKRGTAEYSAARRQGAKDVMNSFSGKNLQPFNEQQTSIYAHPVAKADERDRLISKYAIGCQKPELSYTALVDYEESIHDDIPGAEMITVKRPLAYAFQDHHRNALKSMMTGLLILSWSQFHMVLGVIWRANAAHACYAIETDGLELDRELYEAWFEANEPGVNPYDVPAPLSEAWLAMRQPVPRMDRVHYLQERQFRQTLPANPDPNLDPRCFGYFSCPLMAASWDLRHGLSGGRSLKTDFGDYTTECGIRIDAPGVYRLERNVCAYVGKKCYMIQRGEDGEAKMRFKGVSKSGTFSAEPLVDMARRELIAARDQQVAYQPSAAYRALEKQLLHEGQSVYGAGLFTQLTQGYGANTADFRFRADLKMIEQHRFGLCSGLAIKHLAPPAYCHVVCRPILNAISRDDPTVPAGFIPHSVYTTIATARADDRRACIVRPDPSGTVMCLPDETTLDSAYWYERAPCVHNHRYYRLIQEERALSSEDTERILQAVRSACHPEYGTLGLRSLTVPKPGRAEYHDYVSYDSLKMLTKFIQF